MTIIETSSDFRRDCIGFVFLFPWLEEERNDNEEVTCPSDVYFANQVCPGHVNRDISIESHYK